MNHTHLRFENLHAPARAKAIEQLRTLHLQDPFIRHRLACLHTEAEILSLHEEDIRTRRWQASGRLCCIVGEDPVEERPFEAHLF